MSKRPRPVEFIVSRRSSPRIDKLYVLVVKDADGQEGIVRRDTPFGTQPMITDDLALVDDLRRLTPFLDGEVTIVTFTRSD